MRFVPWLGICCWETPYSYHLGALSLTLIKPAAARQWRQQQLIDDRYFSSSRHLLYICVHIPNFSHTGSGAPNSRPQYKCIVDIAYNIKTVLLSIIVCNISTPSRCVAKAFDGWGWVNRVNLSDHVPDVFCSSTALVVDRSSAHAECIPPHRQCIFTILELLKYW